MKSLIINRLEEMHKRYKEIQILLSDSKTVKDQKYFLTLSRKNANLKVASQYLLKWKKIQKEIKSTKKMLSDPEIRDMAKEELQSIKEYSERIEKKIKDFLIPKDQDDKCNAFIEIRAATGGKEAAIFAGDLFRMYSRYAEMKKWKVEILNINEGEFGGYKEIIAKIIGKEVFSRLKFESGGHRVQRIPLTESQGRVHTSTCTVAVMAELPEENFPKINPTDLRIDTFRSSGAGGQHVNTTDSAIRITHLPTNTVVECQDERSQHRNKEKALSILNARIYNEEKIRRRKNISLTRRNLLGSGDRNDRNRTYNFPKGRVTDHRINLTLYNLNQIIEGKIDVIIDSLIQEHQIDLLKTLLK